MKQKKLLYEIKKLEKDFIELKSLLKSQKILKSKQNSYLKEDKDAFKLIWLKYIDFFLSLQKLIRGSHYRKYIFFIDYNKLVIKKYLLVFYFNCLVSILKIFWEHESFLRVFLSENFKNDYWIFAKFIYKARYINLVNTPNIFIKAFKVYIDKDIYKMIDLETLDINKKRILTDYLNLYFYFKRRLDNIAFFISKNAWYLISKTRFSFRNKWLIKNKNLEKYLSIAKPWDIFLTRWNWNASNLFIPGFWKHMSMYLWTWKFLKDNFNFKDIESLDSNKHYIIEATWKWTKIVEMFVFIKHCDYLWVSRTNFKKEKILRSIKNILWNIWKWYDHIFNFYSDKNLVCSELVLKSYAKEYEKDEWIEIKLEHIWSSLTFPPNKFIEKLKEDNKKEKKEIEPIFFIDSIEKNQENFISTKKEFLKSWTRPRITLFLK